MNAQRTTLLASVLLVLVLLATPSRPAYGEETPAGVGAPERIAWMHDLPAAFEKAAAEQKIVMICINAKNAIGEREEPAAKGLREIVYLDPAVVKKSRAFVCVLLTAEGSSEDYGELRYRLGIDGFIVSPQHIFAHPQHQQGDKPLIRKQYWPHGDGEEAVAALLQLMEDAQGAYGVRERMPDTPPDDGDFDPGGSTAPASGPEHTAWLDKLLALIREPDAATRRHALETLSENDRQGNCTIPLVPLLAEFEKSEDTDALIDVVRTLGIPDLEVAAPALHELLKHKDARVRANAAVTLEYIGSATSVDPLLARVKREKDEAIANHMYRAIGRCGLGSAAAKKKLLRSSLPGKEGDFGSLGAVIGLAYFQGDAKLARAIEKQILKLGSPFDQGKNTHSLLRALQIWCLSEIRDPGSASFLRKRVMKPLEDEENPWKESLFRYYEAVAECCEGKGEARQMVDAGIGRYLWYDDARALVDEYRRGRSMRQFVPKGEWGNKPPDEDE